MRLKEFNVIKDCMDNEVKVYGSDEIIELTGGMIPPVGEV